MTENTIEFSSEEAEEYMLATATSGILELAEVIFNESPIENYVLRSHLWAEREIEQILEYFFPFPKAIIEGRFSFSHKLTLLKGFWGGDENKCKLLSKLDILNKIRNKMAHQINSPKLPSLFSKLDIKYQLDSKNQPSDELIQDIKFKLASIQGSLIGIKSMLLLKSEGHSVVKVES